MSKPKTTLIMSIVILLGFMSATAPVLAHNGEHDTKTVERDGITIGYGFGEYEASEGEGHHVVEQNNHNPGEAARITFYWRMDDKLADIMDSPWGFERLDYVVFHVNKFDFGPCTTEDVRAAGIDRDSDNTGTTTDQDIIRYAGDSECPCDWGFYGNFIRGDEFSAPPEAYNGGPGKGEGEGRKDGDSNLEQYEDDIGLASFDACSTNPSDPGWYQWTWTANGSNWNGYEEGQRVEQDESMQGDYIEFTVNSDWIPICNDCEDMESARENLGPPPNETESTPTPTAVSPTPTANLTITPTPIEGETPPPTRTGTPASGETPTVVPNATDTSMATQTVTNLNDEDGPGTSTIGDGPGLGVIAALAAIAGGILALKRE
jgi:hypothetical protein